MTCGDGARSPSKAETAEGNSDCAKEDERKARHRIESVLPQRKPDAKSAHPQAQCRDENGRILIVELKGEGYWTNGEDDRKIGALGAEMSGRKCLFVMVKKDTLSQIDAVVAQ
ncbi:MAG: hypothetical protein JWR15_2961 [Prosthecobacter sp.]|nr:hypothetical protein [Prosthecobacter sp.]